MQGLNAVANTKRPSLLPAFRPGRQFGRKPFSQPRKPRSPSPSGSTVGKVEADELKALDRLTSDLNHHHAEVFDDKFDSLLADFKCEKLDKAAVFVKDGLARIAHLEAKWQARLKMAARSTKVNANTNMGPKEKRDTLVKSLKVFHVQICALYAPLLVERPLLIDAGKSLFTPVS